MPSLRPVCGTLPYFSLGYEKIFIQRSKAKRPGMKKLSKVNDMVIRFANVNGTGSASANDLFTKAVFRMGIPLSSKNFFPSNIQGLPTWYEVRINEKWTHRQPYGCRPGGGGKSPDFFQRRCLGGYRRVFSL